MTLDDLTILRDLVTHVGVIAREVRQWTLDHKGYDHDRMGFICGELHGLEIYLNGQIDTLRERFAKARVLDAAVPAEDAEARPSEKDTESE